MRQKVVKMFKVVAIDPGKTSGVVAMVASRVRLNNPGAEHIFSEYQFGPQKHHDQLYKFLSDFDPSQLVVERFDQRPGKQSLDLIPREYIGVIEDWAAELDVPIIYQMPAHAKRFWTDDKLKRCSLYKPAMPHANDAMRHMLFYITKVHSDLTFIRMLKN